MTYVIISLIAACIYGMYICVVCEHVVVNLCPHLLHSLYQPVDWFMDIICMPVFCLMIYMYRLLWVWK